MNRKVTPEELWGKDGVHRMLTLLTIAITKNP